jgi:hypothetical protein
VVLRVMVFAHDVLSMNSPEKVVTYVAHKV